MYSTHNKGSKMDVLSHLMKSSDKLILSMTQLATMSSFRSTQAYREKGLGLFARMASNHSIRAKTLITDSQ